SIQTSDHILFLDHAGGLISAMSAVALNAPSAMPGAISDSLGDYWDAGSKAAPRVTDQEISTDEETVLTGTVGAIDHDDNITDYNVSTDAQHGTVSLDA